MVIKWLLLLFGLFRAGDGYVVGFFEELQNLQNGLFAVTAGLFEILGDYLFHARGLGMVARFAAVEISPQRVVMRLGWEQSERQQRKDCSLSNVFALCTRAEGRVRPRLVKARLRFSERPSAGILVQALTAISSPTTGIEERCSGTEETGGN